MLPKSARDVPEESNVLKRSLRQLLETRAGSFPRAVIDRKSFRRARNSLLQESRRNGVKAASLGFFRDLKSGKMAETFFILGSGESVNLLTENHYEIVRSELSAGINHWTLHDFVPDLYFFEPVALSRKGRSPSPLDGSAINHLNHLRVLDRDSVHHSGARILSLAPRSEFEMAQIQQIPPSLRNRLKFYSRFTPFTRNPSNLTGDWMRSLTLSDGEPGALIVPDSGATLARLLAIGVLSQFQRIVLLGVDLSTTYFWQGETAALASPAFREFPQPNKGGIHATVRADIRPFSIIDVVRAYREICAIRGIDLMIRSDSSKLKSLLPTFEW